ncbi:MAG: DUF523 domain-containing protein [Candidatus Heimdallarchaeota archaeon]
MTKEKPPLLVSACLLGVNCTYNEEIRKNDEVLKLAEKYHLIQICPEQLGGLSTPRTSQSIVKGNGHDVLAGKTIVITLKKEDETKAFIRGAKEALRIAQINNAKVAVMRDKSPSCGSAKIYNEPEGSDRVLIDGCGVATALLRENGVKVHPEYDIDSL